MQGTRVGGFEFRGLGLGGDSSGVKGGGVGVHGFKVVGFGFGGLGLGD